MVRQVILQYPTSGGIDGNALSVNANYGFKLGNNGGYLKYYRELLTQRENIQADTGYR